MTEQQQHLHSVTEQQKTVIAEMQTLDQNLNQKKELAIKLQGVIEYLTQLGVTLPKEDSEVTTETQEEVSEVTIKE